jgi:hypothetical protein
MMSKMFAGLFSVFPGLFKGSVRLTHGKKIPLPGY